MFIYTENNIESDRETPKTSIYSPKHTQNTKVHSKIHQNTQNIRTKHLFFKSKKIEFDAEPYGIIYIVEGHTA